MVMAKTASLNATYRPVSRCTEGESAPALPPGARAIASQRTPRSTEDTTAAAREGWASLHHGKAILEPDNTEIYGAYTLIRENLHIHDPGRAR
jgi:hypothetical protein